MFNLTEDRVNVNHLAILLDIVTRRKFRYDGYLTISVIKLLLSVVVVVVDGWLGEVREIFGRRLGDIARSALVGMMMYCEIFDCCNKCGN